MLPEGVTAVPVQGLTWLQGSLKTGDIQLVIKPSKTDYIFIPTRVWNGLMDEGIYTQDYKVKESARLQDRLPGLLRYILGFYEVCLGRKPAWLECL